MVESSDGGAAPSRPGMRRWIVTGPMGSGKSRLVGFLADRGAVRIDADGLGHALLQQREVRDEIRAAFGDAVFDGPEVARSRLGRLVFGNPAALASLNRITHRRLAAGIRAAFAAAAAPGPTLLAVCEAAVYFLLPPLGKIDLTIAVVADEASRRSRLLARGRLTEAEVDRRIAAQRGWGRFWDRADVLIRNQGSVADLEEDARELIQQHLGGLR